MSFKPLFSNRFGTPFDLFLCAFAFFWFWIIASQLGAFDSSSLREDAEKAVEDPRRETAVRARAKLSGTVVHRLKKIDKIILGATLILSKNSAASAEWRVRELESIVDQAKNIMREIQKDHGDRIPPGHPEIKAREDKIAVFETDVAGFKKRIATEKKR